MNTINLKIKWLCGFIFNDETFRYFDENFRYFDEDFRIYLGMNKHPHEGDHMSPRDRKRPTDAELEILRVVWSLGRATVREVYRALRERRETGYTTVLKLMQIMTEKGLLCRDTTVRPQVYRAVQSEEKTQKQLLHDLLERAFQGSPGKLVLQALSTRKASPEERRKIRALLDKLEGEIP
jgi:predicted transcriptional regulator